ncbi:MAG: efflux RND transporter periplasmic adaptor subunit [Firmicutes bacterium HGW-Firmicutes-15]|nr:MAG: efflux RND transporter periplasmic adaptor subunit [Firmicutes bacterium HGW-Firmicutes-15]
MKSKWKLWLIPILFLVIIGLWKSSAIWKHPSVQTITDTVPTVNIKKAALLKKENALQLTGTLEAHETAIISPKSAGRTSQVLVENGTAVTAGQALVMIENQDYLNLLAAAQADLKKAEAKLVSTKTDFERLKELYKNGAISNKDLQDIEMGLKVAEADVEAAAAAAANARNSLDNTTICAPISGIVSNRNVNLGQMLSAGLPLMTVEDISSVYALVNIQQQELSLLKPGLKADVTVDAYGTRRFSGSLTIINPSASSAARVFQAKIKLDNLEQLLRSGMFVRVKIYTGEDQNVLTVPRDALTSQNGLYYVFSPDGGQVKRQQVQIGSIMDQMVEITSGLKEGQPIVVSNVNKLKDQDRIQAISEQGE